MNNQSETNRSIEKLNDHQLIMRYNQELGNPGWTTSRGNFLSDLRAELLTRQIDIETISNDGSGFNLGKEYEAFLSGKKVFLVKDFKNSDTPIDLQFKKDRPSHRVNCLFKRTKAHSINLFQLLEETQIPILLSFEHEQLQTMIDGTGIHNYLMAGFDEHNRLIGVSFFNQMGTGTFGVQSQAKSVLIFHQEQFEFYASQIAGFELVFS